MSEKPILIFPAAVTAARVKLPKNNRPAPKRPSQYHQEQRLSQRLQAIGERLDGVQAAVDGIDPEQVVVLETIGKSVDFQKAVLKIPGMEWLGQFDADAVNPDQGFLKPNQDPAELTALLYVVASSRTACDELVRLWNIWCNSTDGKIEKGYGPLSDAFKHLNDIRLWGSQDRMGGSDLVSQWEAGLASGRSQFRFEVELWCREDTAKRTAAFQKLNEIVRSAGGQCIKQVAITQIHYHGVLLDLPAAEVRNAVEAIHQGTDTALLRLTEVKHFSPMGQASITPAHEGVAAPLSSRPLPTKMPVAAILDGLPLANHALLQGRLVIDDPDGLSAKYQANGHRHGTAMVSLIAHGDLHVDGPSISSKIYVRPVMHSGLPDVQGVSHEEFPSDELAVDLVHRAVKRMFEGDAGQPPQAPTVKIVNLSLGDASQLFDRQMSPWARLLDWLAWKYHILFVVSAGNHPLDILIPGSRTDVTRMTSDELRAHALRAMVEQRNQRRLLAPAESVNALTIGASHDQTVQIPSGRFVDLMHGLHLPSPINPVAGGHRRAIKPEILVPGGRQHYDRRMISRTGQTSHVEHEISRVELQPGQRVASPGGSAMPPQRVTNTCGTSNSAALTTRQAVFFADMIEQLRAEPGGDRLGDAQMAVLLKAMLVHGATWGDDFENLFYSTFVPADRGKKDWQAVKKDCVQFMGYGIADFARGVACSDQRVVVLGAGTLAEGQGHQYAIPLPPALHAQKIKRRLTLTLAWLTPVNPLHQNYSKADLWFDIPDGNFASDRQDADHHSAKRGTVQHVVLEGESAIAILGADTLPLQVNCRAGTTTKLEEAIPYALMVSIEVADPVNASIYAQVKVGLDRLRAPAAVRVAARS